jgi:hypothetical protein
LPEHWVAPGTHTPTQAPATQAELVQAEAVPYCPFEPHVCTLLPVHDMVPGTQTPVQTPPAQA